MSDVMIVVKSRSMQVIAVSQLQFMSQVIPASKVPKDAWEWYGNARNLFSITKYAAVCYIGLIVIFEIRVGIELHRPVFFDCSKLCTDELQL